MKPPQIKQSVSVLSAGRPSYTGSALTDGDGTDPEPEEEPDIVEEEVFENERFQPFR